MNRPNSNRGTCRGCEAPIVWMKTSRGKNMPVDPGEGTEGQRIFDHQTMVSHWDTCPEREQFSARNKAKTAIAAQLQVETKEVHQLRGPSISVGIKEDPDHPGFKFYRPDDSWSTWKIRFRYSRTTGELVEVIMKPEADEPAQAQELSANGSSR